MWLYFPWIGSHTFSAWGFSSAAGLQWKTFFSLSHWHWHFSLFIRHRFDPLPIWVPPFHDLVFFFAFIELLWFFDAQKYTILHSVFCQQTKKPYHICNLCLNSYISLTWCCNNLWESVYSQILKFWIWFWREWKISVASEVTVFSLFTRYCTFDKASSSSYLYLF